jgi:hypothetical protein
MIKINFKEVLNTDVSFLEKYYNRIGHIDSAFKETSPTIEHYKLLTYLSFQFNNSIIIDAGTLDGLSAISLAQNRTNHVISYDIVDRDFNQILNNTYDKSVIQHTPFGMDYTNIEFRKMDINNELDESILSASLILLDLSHNGSDEEIFSNKIQSIKYNGYVICDDIYTSAFPLTIWYESLIWDKYNLTKVGHCTGTGLLDCGKNGVLIVE